MWTQKQIEQALVEADASGDTEAVKILATMLEDTIASNPAKGGPRGSNVAAGAGKWVTDGARALEQMVARPARGIEQLFSGPKTLSSLVTGGTQDGPATRWANRVDKEEADTNARDAALMNTTGGKAGYFGAALLPFTGMATTAPRIAAAAGGVMSALMPTGNELDRTKNTAVGTAIGGSRAFGIRRSGRRRRAARKRPNAAATTCCRARSPDLVRRNRSRGGSPTHQALLASSAPAGTRSARS
jgi:hypothetical protein